MDIWMAVLQLPENFLKVSQIRFEPCPDIWFWNYKTSFIHGYTGYSGRATYIYLRILLTWRYSFHEYGVRKIFDTFSLAKYMQTCLCSFSQLSFWHSLLQYATRLHEPHLLSFSEGWRHEKQTACLMAMTGFFQSGSRTITCGWVAILWIWCSRWKDVCGWMFMKG